MKWILALMLILSMIPLGYSDAAISCVNETHQIDRATFTIDGNTTQFEVVEECPFGCSNDLSTCKPASFKANSIGFSIIFIMAFLIIFALRKMGEATDIAFTLLSIVPIVFAAMGFVDFFSTTMRLLFGIMFLLSVLVILIADSLMKTSGKLSKR